MQLIIHLNIVNLEMQVTTMHRCAIVEPEATVVSATNIAKLRLAHEHNARGHNVQLESLSTAFISHTYSARAVATSVQETQILVLQRADPGTLQRLVVLCRLVRVFHLPLRTAATQTEQCIKQRSSCS